MAEEVQLPRLIILGAGFSKPAGLPLSTELLDLVLADLRRFEGRETHLHRSLVAYLNYKAATSGTHPDSVDIEDFAAYLDYRHAFGLLGSDTWSESGNRDQLLLRFGIGRVLHRLTPEANQLPALYQEFASRLRPKDVVLTFNYDLLLERALDRVGKPYRRFPHRFSQVGPTSATVDTDRDAAEVTIIKAHGSLDWVSKVPYEDKLTYMERAVENGRRFAEERDLLFGPNGISPTSPLVEGPRFDDDPLVAIQVIEDLAGYYGSRQVAYFHPPLVLAPSQAKQLYGTAFRTFWEGLAIGGFARRGISVVGYSLPPADPYAQLVLYEVVRQYQVGLEDSGWCIGPMEMIGLIDRRSSKSAREELLQRYRFLPERYTSTYFDGFDIASLDVIFSNTPIVAPEQAESEDD